MPFAKKVISGGIGISKDDIDKINKGIEDRFNALTSKQQQDAEVIDARDGETSLKARLNRDKEELDKIRKLEESTVSTITTESGFTTVEETSNGYFEDVKLEGRTVKGECLYTDITLGHCATTTGESILSQTKGLTLNFREAKPNTKYTISSNVVDGKSRYCYLEFNSEGDRVLNSAWVSTDSTKTVITKSTTSRMVLSVVCDDSSVSSQTVQQAIDLYRPLIVEGDRVNNLPTIYYGLMSVGQDVEEVSVKSVNENLFDGNVSLGYLSENGSIISHKTWVVSDFIDIQGVSQLRFESTVFNGLQTIGLYNSDKELVSYTFAPATFVKVDKSVKYVRVAMCKSPETEPTQFELENPCIEMYVTNKTGKKHQSNKKPLLYYNPETQTWEKPILRQWNSIEKHSDGKYYYHKRSGEVVLNGSDNSMGLWIESSMNSSLTDCKVFILENFTNNHPYIEKNNTSSISKIISDKFNAISVIETTNLLNALREGISVYNSDSQLRFVINSSKLSTQNLEGFKAWLQANPTTVVYQLAEEKVYECTNIDLITYNGETNYVVNCGAIVPKSTLKVMTNISNIVRELQIKVSTLEGYIQYVMLDALKNALNE